jgi:hypothetical protein
MSNLNSQFGAESRGCYCDITKGAFTVFVRKFCSQIKVSVILKKHIGVAVFLVFCKVCKYCGFFAGFSNKHRIFPSAMYMLYLANGNVCFH